MTEPDLASPRDRSSGEGDAVAAFLPVVVLLGLLAVLVLSQLYAVIPVFGVLADDLGLDAQRVTVTHTAFGIAYAVGFLAWGAVVDRIGPRRTLLTGLGALVPATVLVATARDATWMIAARVLQGAVAAAFAPAAFAYVGTRIAVARRATALSVLTGSFLASVVLGQIAAQAVSALAGWRWFFGIGAVLFAVATVAVLAAVDDEPPPRPGPQPVTAAVALLGSARTVAVLAVTATVLAGFVALHTGVQRFAVVADPDDLLVFRASALPAIVAAPLLSGLLGRIRTGHRIVVFLLVAAACATVAQDAPVAAFAAITFCVAVIAPALIALVLDRSGPHRGAGTALYTCALFVGAGLGPQIAATASSFSATALAAAGVWTGGAALAAISSGRPTARFRPGARGRRGPRASCPPTSPTRTARRDVAPSGAGKGRGRPAIRRSRRRRPRRGRRTVPRTGG